MPEKTIHTKRKEQVLDPQGNYAFSTFHIDGLIQSARLLLEAGRRDKPPNEGDNFLTTYAPSVILLATIAFDSFLDRLHHWMLRLIIHTSP